jgi:hypothetical protein
VPVDCSGASGTLAPNATKSCSNATYAMTQADLDAGSVINTATATAKLASDTSKIVISDPVSVTVITYTLPRLQLTTSVNPPYWQTSATLLTFTYSLRNTGGVDLDAPYTLSQGVKVDDWNCDAATSPLPPGGITTCTGHYTTNPSDNSGTTITSKAQFTALDGTVGVDSNLYVIPVPRFVCNTSLLKHREPTPMIPNGAPTQDVVWMLANYTGLPVHIASIFVKWNAAPPNLVQIFLNGISIYNYPTSTYAGFYVPTSTGPWILPTGVDTPMEFLLTANATSMRVILTFQEVDCGIVDSNLGYPDTP